MESVEMTYRPKDGEVSYQEFQRGRGYTSRIVHMHDAHEICFIRSRSVCELFSGGNRWIIQGPAIILHRAGSYHELMSISPEGEAYDGSVIYFQSSSLPRAYLPKQLFDWDCLVLPLENTAAFDPYFDLVKREADQRKPLALLMILSRMAQEENVSKTAIQGNAKDSYIFDVIRHLQAHYSEPLTVKSLAKDFHVSESKLKQDFSAMTGLTIKRFVVTLRMRQGCRLLKNTNQDISAIAYQLGFSSESHFIEVFHTHIGMTPRKYRVSEAIEDV